MNKRDLNRIILKVNIEGRIFSDKSQLDTLTLPEKIVGRQKKAEELLRHLLGYKQGFVPPLISVYGRSGSGKSTITKFVCENIEDAAYCFVNLRMAKTPFGVANLILSELHQDPTKSAQGISESIEKIGQTIECELNKGKKLFILVLDEIDILFDDKRQKASDFLYKLLMLEENFRKKGFLVSIITLSNNLIGDYELDDRVRSRIGNSEVYFEPYKEDDVFAILRDRARKSFVNQIDDKILEKCAKLSYLEHGDARRAIDLLRVAAEIASSKSRKLTVEYVEQATDNLQKNTVKQFYENAPFHSKYLLFAIARLCFLTNSNRYPTSTIYRQYRMLLPEDQKPLTSRRISDLLAEMKQAGILSSQTKSSGRYGYGTLYELRISPNMILVNFEKKFEELRKYKAKHLDVKEHPKWKMGDVSIKGWDKYYEKVSWRQYVGLN